MGERPLISTIFEIVTTLISSEHLFTSGANYIFLMSINIVALHMMLILEHLITL